MACGEGASTWAKVDESNYRKVVEKLPGEFASLKETLRANYDDVIEEVRDEALRFSMAAEVPAHNIVAFLAHGGVPLTDTRGQPGAAPAQSSAAVAQFFTLVDARDEEILFQDDPRAHLKCQRSCCTDALRLLVRRIALQICATPARTHQRRTCPWA